jgi:hypothetical protein
MLNSGEKFPLRATKKINIHKKRMKPGEKNIQCNKTNST